MVGNDVQGRRQRMAELAVRTQRRIETMAEEQARSLAERVRSANPEPPVSAEEAARRLDEF